jgi:hypothetical protein
MQLSYGISVLLECNDIVNFTYYSAISVRRNNQRILVEIRNKHMNDEFTRPEAAGVERLVNASHTILFHQTKLPTFRFHERAAAHLLEIINSSEIDCESSQTSRRRSGTAEQNANTLVRQPKSSTLLNA